MVLQLAAIMVLLLVEVGVAFLLDHNGDDLDA
jgi:hypothetical protein